MSSNLNSKVAFANTLRGFAAIAVVLSHYFCTFWFAREEVTQFTNSPTLSLLTHPTPDYIVLMNNTGFFNWAGFGVGLFFLISGFVIPFSLRKLDAIQFLIARFFRIVPTYMVGFSITLLMVFLAGLYFNNPFPYKISQILLHSIPGLRDITGTRPIDAIIWTLEIEVKFYVLCALVAPWFKQSSSKVFLIPVALAVMALFVSSQVTDVIDVNLRLLKYASGFVLVTQFIIFMFIGVALNFYYQKVIRSEVAMLLVGALFMLFAFVWHTGMYKSSINVMWIYGFVILAFVFAITYPKIFIGNKVTNFIANISYPLYVVHGVPGYVLLRVLLDMGVNIELALASACTFAVTMAFIVHKVIEIPSQRWGKNISGKIKRDDTDIPPASFQPA